MIRAPRRLTITWIDSAFTHGWQDPTLVDAEPMTCETTGYLIKRGKAGIVMALNRTASERAKKEFGDYITIPTVAVKKVRRVS